MSHAGNLDLVLGAYTGFFYLFVNTMLPEFAQRTGSANPLEMDSPLVADLPSGTRVVVEKRATSRTGVERCRVSSGKSEGWLSAKVLAPADGA